VACGGVGGGRALKAVIPGGSSVPVMIPKEVETATMDYESLAQHGTMLGSGGFIVMDETANMVDALSNLLNFYAHESCGQCSPCREGTGWAAKVLRHMIAGSGRGGDIEELLDIANNMMGKTICVLADAAAMPIQSYIKKFRSEFEAALIQTAAKKVA